jgi:hypothetical protein
MNFTPTDLAWMLPLGSFSVLLFIFTLWLQNKRFAMEAKERADAEAAARATAEPESRSRSAE